MGLDIKVGYLAEITSRDGKDSSEWLRRELFEINEALRQMGLSHQEPDFLPALDSRGSGDDFPYPWLHYLRRFYAHAVKSPGTTPPPVGSDEDPAEDPVLESLFDCTFDSPRAPHLLFHSDHDGFYFPLDFRGVIYDVPGGPLGSSYRLRDELTSIASLLEIRVVDGQLSDQEAARLAEFDDIGPFHRERAMWFSLFERARLSIEHKTAICFR